MVVYTTKKGKGKGKCICRITHTALRHGSQFYTNAYFYLASVHLMALHRLRWRTRISGQLFTTQATEATSKTKCQKKLTPYLETTKDIATKRKEALSGYEIYRPANFHADRWHLRRDICPRTRSKIHTYKKLQQMIYLTRRILALRCVASYNNTCFH